MGEGRVYAFEPDPNNRKLLEQTVEENGWNTRLKVSSRALWKVSPLSPQILSISKC